MEFYCITKDYCKGVLSYNKRKLTRKKALKDLS